MATEGGPAEKAPTVAADRGETATPDRPDVEHLPDGGRSADPVEPDFRAHLYDADGRDRDVPLTRDLVDAVDDRQLLWVDVAGREDGILGIVGERLRIAAPAVALLRAEAGRARLIRYRTSLHLTVEAVEMVDGRLARRELDLLAGRNVVVTVHDGPIDALERFQAELRGDTLIGKLDAGGFLAALIDTVLSTYFARVDEIERDIDRLDEIALSGPDSETFLVDVLELRRRIALLRRTIAPHREAFAPLVRPDVDLDEALGRPWPGLADRLERVMDAVENARELLVGSFDIYLGGAAKRSNDVMKVLTVLSAVLLPGVVLAGVMGMNFKLSFFENPLNFWFVIGGMAVFAAVILGTARLRRWI